MVVVIPTGDLGATLGDIGGLWQVGLSLHWSQWDCDLFIIYFCFPFTLSVP